MATDTQRAIVRGMLLALSYELEARAVNLLHMVDTRPYLVDLRPGITEYAEALYQDSLYLERDAEKLD